MQINEIFSSIDGEGIRIKKTEKFVNIHNAIRIVK